MIRKGSRYPARFMKGSRAVDVLTKGDRPIWMSVAAQKTVQKIWLDAHVTTTAVIVDDSQGKWFELEIVLPGDFTGNPVDGWSGVMVSGKPPVTLGIFSSPTLHAMATGGWAAAPGKTTETLPDGRKKWFARHEVPVWLVDVMVDLSLTSDRYGKSITAISVFDAPVSLPNFPYDMPADAAQLQTDLRAAGYTDATATTTSGSLVATARWHTQAANKLLHVTMAGSNVTDVRYEGTTVGTGYPFSMPSRQAALQTMLTSALGGDANNRAVVKLHGDTWEVFLPDRDAVANLREFSLVISPSDPFPVWDTFSGAYMGQLPDTYISGTSGNVRTPAGIPLLENLKNFAAVGFVL